MLKKSIISWFISSSSQQIFIEHLVCQGTVFSRVRFSEIKKKDMVLCLMEWGGGGGQTLSKYIIAK